MWPSYDNESWPVTPPEVLNISHSEPPVNVQQTVIAVSSSLIACVGLVGNALNFFVLQAYHTSLISYGGECTARVNLLGLAIADFFLCLITLPLSFAKREYKSKSFMLFYTLVGPGLATYFLTVSVWMVLLMSIVRYWAVCRPLTSRTWLTQLHMLRVIVILYVSGLLFHIPALIRLRYEEDCGSVSDTGLLATNSSAPCGDLPQPTFTTYVIYEKDLWPNQTVKLIYHTVEIFLTNIGPLVGVVLSNLAVIRACKRSDACRRSFAESSQQFHNKNGIASSVATEPAYVPTARAHPLYKRAITATRDQIYTTPGVFVFSPTIPFRQSLHRYNNRATNRVTPLLLTVIFAFLLFIAPFGIVHLVCVQVMRDMGERVRDDPEARSLYAALNLTVQWTNVVQLLGCALNFFLYFLVSTTFRRTTKRTFKKFYNRLRSCQQEFRRSFRIHSSTPTEFSDDDIRTNELRRALNLKLAPVCVTDARLTANRSDANMRQRITHLFRLRRTTPTPPSTNCTGEPHVHSCPLPGSRWNSDLLDTMVINHSCGQLKCDCEVCCSAPPVFGQFNARCPHCSQLFTLDISLPEKQLQSTTLPSTSRQKRLRTSHNGNRQFHSKCSGCYSYNYDLKRTPRRFTQNDEDRSIPKEEIRHFPNPYDKNSRHSYHHFYRVQCPPKTHFSAQEANT
ncbi:cholecystokinin receptor type A [Clonorchis sinensis]|nr:cholecystokinin receptor type A [Clonorchis sinensis]